MTAGASGLAYDALAGQYRYRWKTVKAWAGTCRRLVLAFAHGTQQVATFEFTR